MKTTTKLQLWPYVPGRPEWDALLKVWLERFPTMGYIGNDGEHAYFQARGTNRVEIIELTELKK